MKRNKSNIGTVTRYNPSLDKGLTTEQVQSRKEANLINKSVKVKGKTHFQIIFSSFFTFFNVILYGLALVFLGFQLFYPDGLKYIPITKYGFMFVIICNATTSIVSQEISKRTVEKMKLLTDPKGLVIREGKEEIINIEDIVLDDLVVLSSGNDVPCDLIVEDGEVLVNESMLTGESDPLIKKIGDEIFSGSYIISGTCKAKANKIGKDTYVSKLEGKISSIKKKKSVLMENIHKIIKYLLFFLVPATAAVFIKTYYVGIDGVHWVFTPEVITKTGATLVGMIPIGMILLSSITLSQSIVKLFKKQTMVQELYAIENLSRVNTLCLDKTGTLTTQKFIVEEVVNVGEEDINQIMPFYLGASSDGNATSNALLNHYGKIDNAKYLRFEPFDSTKKCSRVYVNESDYYSLGAPDYIFKDKNMSLKYKKYLEEGCRVIGLTHNDIPVGFIVLKDELRKNIKSTLSYFDELGVDIMIISGDNVTTVQQISKQAGVKNYDKAISMEGVTLEEIPNLIDKYYIFGRTSPDQKQEIIKQLELRGKMVGYVGDGVNDTQSLRQANCSIALKSGADSTKAVSDVVLLDDDFSHLPDVLKEGRRVVTNIQRSLLLFLTKSIFIGLFSLASIFMKEGMPIEIEAIYIYEFISVALCGFLLSIENNKPEADDGKFVTKVFYRSFCFGVFMFVGAILPVIINAFYPLTHLAGIITMNVTISGIVILLSICRPFTKYTKVVFGVGFVISVLFLLAFPQVFLEPEYLKGANGLSDQINLIFKTFFDLSYFNAYKWPEYLIVLLYLFLSYFVYIGLDYLFKICLFYLSKFMHIGVTGAKA